MQRLQSVVDGGLAEGGQLDSNERYPGSADSERREFPTAVSSFANSALFADVGVRGRDMRALVAAGR